MSDIITRLVVMAEQDETASQREGNLLREAADEIERLRRRETELTAVIEAQLHRVNDLSTDAKRWRDFAERVYRDQFSPGWLHDRAAKLLDMPSLTHGYDYTEEGDS
jgi:hypothetical protein